MMYAENTFETPGKKKFVITKILHLYPDLNKEELSLYIDIIHSRYSSKLSPKHQKNKKKKCTIL